MIDIKRRATENEEQYIWRLGQAKSAGMLNLDWKEIAALVNKEFHDEDKPLDESAFRKPYQYVKRFLDAGVLCDSRDDYWIQLEQKKEEVQREIAKLQTLNLERNRTLRQDARYEHFHQYLSKVIESLPLPEFKPLPHPTKEVSYFDILTISDIHYGAKFVSENNAYSPEICKDRFEKLLISTRNYVQSNNIANLSIATLGDSIQGILRMSDLKINESTVVESIVEVSRLIAWFLNELSADVNIDYYHVTASNHTQTRPLGTKASELSTEDVEYIIGNYIMDLLRDNVRVNVHLNLGKSYIGIPIFGFNAIALHGHTIKNTETFLRDLSMMHHKIYDYAFVGHYHSGKEISVSENLRNDAEVFICPSFIGSDEYSDSLMKGSKAACKVYRFDNAHGHVSTTKIYLN